MYEYRIENSKGNLQRTLLAQTQKYSLTYLEESDSNVHIYLEKKSNI